MAARTRKATWTFRSTAALVAWAADEYLSEITLDDMKPAPAEGGHPDVVAFTWSLHGTGNGAVVPYRARAEGVRTWARAGADDARAISLDALSGAGVCLRMGSVELGCDAVTFTRGAPIAARSSKQKARPFTDYGYMLVDGGGVLTAGEIVDALGAPATAGTVARDAVMRAPPAHGFLRFAVVVDGVTWLHVHNLCAAVPAGYRMSIARAEAPDAAWHRAQELPARLRATRVVSAWELDGDVAAWMRAIGKSSRSN